MKPILFKSEMIRAILEGRKFQTRRIIKPQPDIDGLWNHDIHPMSLQSDLRGWNGSTETGQSREWKCPFGEAGEILWARETFCYDSTNDKDFFIVYKADCETYPMGSNHWKPSIFMPKDACRIFLKVQEIIIERVQMISYHDAIAEGVYREWDGTHYWYKDYLNPKGAMIKNNPIESYKTLWVSINGQESWDANPFVWVVDFDKTNTPNPHHPVKGGNKVKNKM